ncbi:MAG TPA: hypothetical protein DEB47_04550, partial [Citreicella sp.]|nr:hypothetical protein [Citreicella sp.]
MARLGQPSPQHLRAQPGSGRDILCRQRVQPVGGGKAGHREPARGTVGLQHVQHLRQHRSAGQIGRGKSQGGEACGLRLQKAVQMADRIRQHRGKQLLDAIMVAGGAAAKEVTKALCG